MMRHSAIAAALLALGFSLSALGAPPEPGAEGEPPAHEQPSAPAEPAGAPAPAQSSLEVINYSLGFELGEDLKSNNLEAMPEALLKGVTDALSGAKPQFKPSERRKALIDIKNKRAQANLERSQAFLAENAKKEAVVTLPSGLQYRELQPGEGKTPGLENRVTVNYRGTLVDGTEFDSSYQRGEPAQFEVRRVIKGWREALQLMKEGAKWELVLPPELAYGKTSPNKRIPPNSALIFEVELLSVDPAPPPRSREGMMPRMPTETDEE